MSSLAIVLHMVSIDRSGHSVAYGDLEILIFFKYKNEKDPSARAAEEARESPGASSPAQPTKRARGRQVGPARRRTAPRAGAQPR